MVASSSTSSRTIPVNVRWPYLTVGSRKALTPLLTASIPVIAVQPLANARKSNQRVTPSAAACSGGGRGRGGRAAACEDCFHNPEEQQPTHTGDKQVSRDRKHKARLEGTSEIE